MIAAAFSRVADRLLVADPGLVRLHTALRVALACLLTGIASIAWTVFHHQPITLAAPGILFAMVAPLFVRDASGVSRDADRPFVIAGTLVLGGHHDVCRVPRHEVARRYRHRGTQRLVGTLAGAIVSVLLVAPLHDSPVLLIALRDVVRLGGSGSARPTRETATAMRKLDRSWHDLRNALKPLQTQRVVVWNPDVELATGSLLCCLHWARVLGDSARRSEVPSGEAARNAAEVGSAHVESIVARLDSLIARYGGGMPVVATERDARGQMLDAAVNAVKVPALAQLNAAVEQLFERLAQPRLAKHGGGLIGCCADETCRGGDLDVSHSACFKFPES